MLQTPDISDKLLKLDLKTFLDQNLTLSPQHFILTDKNYNVNEKWWLAEQLKLYGKVNKKIDTFKSKYCWLTTKAYEQCSSEVCANYKANLFKGNKILDLTGGLGVDDFAFSKTFNKVISIDSNKQINTIAKINFTKLGSNNIERITETATNFLKNNTQNFDLIYVDADRRAGKEKSVLLTDGSPNVLEILHTCLQFTNKVLLKLSPLIDLTYCINNLPNLTNIILVEFENELKEILCLVEPNKKKLNIKTAWLTETETQENNYTFGLKQPLAFKEPTIGNILFEPSAAIRKANLTLTYGSLFKLNTLNKSGNYLIGKNLNRIFKGRQFIIEDIIAFNDKNFKHYLKSSQIKKANIAAKDFVLKPEEIYKKYKLQTGGDLYLFFTTLYNSKKTVFVCKKPNL